MNRSELSDAQLDANRANALKSTGPRTDQGKARSSQNAVKHELFRTVLVLEDEDQDEFDDLLRGVMNSYEPQNVAEQLLIEQIVAANWKLRRLQRCERELYGSAALDDTDDYYGYADEDEPVGFNAPAVLEQMLASKTRAPQIERLMQIEQRLQGTIARAQRELERLRKLRREARKDEEQGLHLPLKIEITPLQNEADPDVSEAEADSCADEPAGDPHEPEDEIPPEADQPDVTDDNEEAPDPDLRL